MEQATGVEPASKAWEAFILPMNYACEDFTNIAQSAGKIKQALKFFSDRFWHFSAQADRPAQNARTVSPMRAFQCG